MIRKCKVQSFMTNIICDKCNEIMSSNNNTVLATYPPIYIYVCPKCGDVKQSHEVYPLITYEEIKE